MPRESRSRQPRGRSASERGDTLIEVLVSTLLIALIVIGTFTGLDSTNRTSALQRSRTQADALAQQAEDQLRTESITKLGELVGRTETIPVTQNGTEYTITNTAEYIEDSSATSSCSSSATKAEYIRTVSKVTWPSLGPGKPVIESGIISPPPDAALIVQMTESGTALPNATVTATGPLPEATTHSLESSSNGCAILALSPGEYDLNASKSGYVDVNGYASTFADPSGSVTHSLYLTAETTGKVGFNLGRAGGLNVSFTGSTPAEGDQFVAFNSGMTTPKTFGSAETYASSISSSNTLFPFTTEYTVYPGSCEADLPPTSVIEAHKANFHATVPPGGTSSITTIAPPINIKVLENKKGEPEKPLQNALVRLQDNGCPGSVHESKTTSSGALPRPGMPFGNYSLCTTATIATKPRKYATTVTNASASGTSLLTIYLREEGKEELGCP